ncbi:MAG: aspartate carbamoyltransferase catalytic subunit [Dehalococcoidia bacterium]
MTTEITSRVSATAARGAHTRATPAPRAWVHANILDLDDFSRDEILIVLDLADRMREILDRRIARVPALRGFTVVNLFYEPSTRTRASFELAGKVLGADVLSLSASTSSVQKGESLIDTVRTMRAMRADAIVIRHAMAGAPYLAAAHTDAAIINAGDGAHAHPTQALLDLYTMRRHVGELAGKRVVMVGDIAHSRVARSDLWGLTTMGADVVVCGPPTLLPRGLRVGDRPAHAESALPPVTIETNADRALEGADVVMALRLQSERQEGGLLPSLHEYAEYYQVTEARLARAKPNHLLMHPGPKNEGIEIAGPVARGSHSIIEEQVTNGVAVRMALLYLLSGGTEPPGGDAPVRGAEEGARR